MGGWSVDQSVGRPYSDLMSKAVGLYQAKTHLSQLVERAAAGEEVVICKSGKPRARLVAMRKGRKPRRRPGGWQGKVVIADDFDAPLPDDILDAFEGKS